jgi:hypothetical protein
MEVCTERVICSICGEEGFARPEDAVLEWFGAELQHADPEVCAENLKRQKKVAKDGQGVPCQ